MPFRGLARRLSRPVEISYFAQIYPFSACAAGITGVYTALPLTRDIPAGPAMGPMASFVGFFWMDFSGL
jgi:hypothetical protein